MNALLACSACALRSGSGGWWTISIMIVAPFAVVGVVGYLAIRAGRAP